jgi:hypothetical protein
MDRELVMNKFGVEEPRDRQGQAERRETGISMAVGIGRMSRLKFVSELTVRALEKGQFAAAVAKMANGLPMAGFPMRRKARRWRSMDDSLVRTMGAFLADTDVLAPAIIMRSMVHKRPTS